MAIPQWCITWRVVWWGWAAIDSNCEGIDTSCYMHMPCCGGCCLSSWFGGVIFCWSGCMMPFPFLLWPPDSWSSSKTTKLRENMMEGKEERRWREWTETLSDCFIVEQWVVREEYWRSTAINGGFGEEAREAGVMSRCDEEARCARCFIMGEHGREGKVHDKNNLVNKACVKRCLHKIVWKLRKRKNTEDSDSRSVNEDNKYNTNEEMDE